eukprot:NODE_1357_length_1456_cov_11.246624_g1125_i0.p1 GENE.NODE_1357_length_1456_cov_11.246624_g1125_i0~~NODE_1357_length_1456_cov_11.246624_g1125_i0.p1  ORF type:complete len:465 (+),score=130.39 NODE_1357_length_1456_cov_11.246624_g1125_i0:114-1397(+)
MFGLRGLEQNVAQALKYFEMAIQAGNNAGHCAVGQIYAQGAPDVPRSYAKALKHFRMASSEHACLNGLGFLYMNGFVVEQNYSQAAIYFESAAQLKNAEAQYNYALLLLNGQGVKRDPGKALLYLQKAVKEGQSLAFYQLAHIYLHGIGVPKKCDLAVKYFRSLIQKGQWDQGLTVAFNDYVAGDYGTALLGYLEKAEQGYALAQSNAAFLLDRGLGLPDLGLDLSPRPAALRQYELASDQGVEDALVKLGDYFYYGYGTPNGVPLLEKAVHYYRLGKEGKQAEAMFNLGYMYQFGIFLRQDFFLAKRHYDLAASADPAAWMAIRMALWGIQLHRFWIGEPSRQGVSASAVNSGEAQPPIHFMRLWGWKLEDVLFVLFMALYAVLYTLRNLSLAPPPPAPVAPAPQPAADERVEDQPAPPDQDEQQE